MLCIWVTNLIHKHTLIYNLQLFGQIQILKTFYIQNKRVNIPNKLKKYLLEI